MSPPPAVTPMSRDLADADVAAAEARLQDDVVFSNHTPLRPVPLSGALTYSFSGDRIAIGSGEIATADTFVAFAGETSFSGQNSRLPFHVTSANWQESDRLLAGLMTAFGAATRATEMDGAGEFDGVMLGAFRRPRIEGRFRGRAMQAFDVIWGDAEGDVVIENSYANVSNAVITRGTSRMDVSGLFSLGFPRRDGGEEINARIRIEGRPVFDLLDAFDLEDYPVTGSLGGEFHVYGPYTRPFGFGRMTIDRRQRLQRALRDSDRRAALRGQRRSPRRDADLEGHWLDHRGGLRRLGRHLLVQRRGARCRGGSARHRDVRRLAAVHGCRAFYRGRQRDLCGAAIRRPDRRPGPVFRRRRDRRGQRPALRAQRNADLRDGSGVDASGGLGHGPHDHRRRAGQRRPHVPCV